MEFSQNGWGFDPVLGISREGNGKPYLLCVITKTYNVLIDGMVKKISNSFCNDFNILLTKNLIRQFGIDLVSAYVFLNSDLLSIILVHRNF